MKTKQATGKPIYLLLTLLQIGPLTLSGQVLHYRFSGTVLDGHSEVDFDSEEIVYSEGSIGPGDRISGTVKVDRTQEFSITPATDVNGETLPFPLENRIYPTAGFDVKLLVNDVPFLASPPGARMDIGTFNDTDIRPGTRGFPLGDGIADAVILIDWNGVPRNGNESERYSLALNFTDSTAMALSAPGYPDPLDLDAYDLATGFILPWSIPFPEVNHGVMFDIDTFELIETLAREVVEKGPESQVVQAGDDLRLTMTEVPGNQGVECQWSKNGVDLPGETLPGLTLNNIQPIDAGTYRVTAWNNLGTTNVALARIEVIGHRHRIEPIAVSGWNADLILAPGEEFGAFPAFDGWLGHWIAAGYEEHADGFPTDAHFTSAVNPDITYSLQDYHANNVLWLLNPDIAAENPDHGEFSDHGILVLDRPRKLTSLAIAAASGSGGGNGFLTLHFTDGTRSRRIPFNANDWWTRPDLSQEAAIAGLGRMIGSPAGDTGVYESARGFGFGLYETEIDLIRRGYANQEIASLEFQKPSESFTTGIFAVSGQSAELRMGVHVSWSSEQEIDLLDVSHSPEGPWTPLNATQTSIVADRTMGLVPLSRPAHFARRRPTALDGSLLGFFDFSREARDRLGKVMPWEIQGQVTFHDNVMEIPEQKTSLPIATGLPVVNYNNATIGLDFLPSEAMATSEHDLITGGVDYRWVRLYTREGKLAVTLGFDEFEHTYPDVSIETGQWHRLLCAINVRSGTIQILLDGEQLPTVDLGQRFRYQFNSADAAEQTRRLSFQAAPGSAPFSGLIDNVMAYRRALDWEQMKTIHDLLEPVAIDTVNSGATNPDNLHSTYHLAWEGNLGDFQLEKAPSAIGPWEPYPPLETEIDGRRIALPDANESKGIFRLQTPE